MALLSAAWPAALAALPADELPDADLLDRFLADRDETAFRLLVGRHGPMVLGVCRRVLGDGHAAEDAFQAAFLVLVRRAREAARGQLGPWLHGIALRTALKARTAAARRLAHERGAAGLRSVAVRPPEPVADLCSVLDEELRRLPDDLRAAVVLCDLEGHSRRQAARSLGLPESTLSSRLAVARRRLARRLAARGVTLSVAGLVAAVPPALADRAAAAALGDAVPPSVTLLSNQVVQAMTWPRKLIAAGLVLAAAAAGTVTVGVSADDRKPDPESRKAPVRTARLDGFRFLAFDGFDGQLGLNWQVVRPDPSHVSLTRHPGRLTITTQKGSIHGPDGGTAGYEAELLQQWGKGIGNSAEEGGQKRGNVNDPIASRATKNLHLIDNPLARDADFTVTTCVVNFDPHKQYQQAGLILYSDDDNYMKWTYEFNDGWLPGAVGSSVMGEFEKAMGYYPPAKALVQKATQNQSDAARKARAEEAMKTIYGHMPDGRPFFVLVGETGGNPTHHIAAEAEPKLPRVWLRVTKRGNLYDCFTSTDGEHFARRGTAEWGKGGPKRIGLIAQNGGEPGVPEIEAQFEFFELRSP